MVIHSDYLATPYAINKLTAEYYCKFYSENFGVSPIVIGRYFNVFGPGDVPGKYRNVIPNFISRILEDKEIVCYGDGSDTRSYSYIDDIVNMTLFVTSNCSSKYEVINLGDHHYEKSILEIISCIERSINVKAKITYLPVREWEDCKNRSCDNTKLLNIGFNDWSSKSFDEKIDETVEFIKGL